MVFAPPRRIDPYDLPVLGKTPSHLAGSTCKPGEIDLSMYGQPERIPQILYRSSNIDAVLLMISLSVPKLMVQNAAVSSSETANVDREMRARFLMSTVQWSIETF